MEITTTIFFIAILILSVIIHEVSHGFAADWLGDPTPRTQGRLTLNPIPHLDLFGSIILPTLLVLSGTGFILGWAKPVHFNPFNLRDRKWGPAIVAAAGPISNLTIALIFGLIIRFAGPMGITSEGFLFIATGIVFVNVLLAVFNLIPIPPLDGHHILFAALPAKYNAFKNFMFKYSLVFLLIIIFFLWQFIMPVIMWVYELFVGAPFLG
jgi:Zn-dependent protease